MRSPSNPHLSTSELDKSSFDCGTLTLELETPGSEHEVSTLELGTMALLLKK